MLQKSQNAVRLNQLQQLDQRIEMFLMVIGVTECSAIYGAFWKRFSLPRQPKGHKIHLESRASGQCQLKCNLKGAPRQGTGQSGRSVLVRSAGRGSKQ